MNLLLAMSDFNHVIKFSWEVQNQNHCKLSLLSMSTRKSSHNLSTEQDLTIKIIVVIEESTPGTSFTDWANNAYLKVDGQLLFGDKRGSGSIFQYCRQSRYRVLRDSYKAFLIGGKRSTWKPLTASESNPLVWLENIHPIRALTSQELFRQTQRGISPTSQKTMSRRGRSRGTTPPPSNVKTVAVKEDE